MRMRRARAVSSMVLMGATASLLWGCASAPPPRGGAQAPASAPASDGAAAPARPLTDGPPELLNERPPADLMDVPDAQPRIEPILPKGPNKPYEVLGQAYAPLASDVPFSQRGQASWYGAKFHGRRTASGEVYSMYGMTAAHRTLPIPSYARVRNVATGKEVIVRINDRGPFHSSRVLDLSYTAAAKLDVLSRGVAEVQIERLTFEQIRSGQWRSALPALAQGDAAMVGATEGAVEGGGEVSLVRRQEDAAADPIFALATELQEALPASGQGASTAASVVPRASVPAQEARSLAYTPGAKGFWVQLAAFRQRQGLDAFQQKVAKELHHLAPLLAVFDDGALLRLQVGPYGRRDEAQSVAQRVRDALHLTPMVIERR